MEWSKYSQDIFDAYQSTDSNLIVQACPGAGKTTNIKHLWSLDDKSTVYLVFNKHNQLEAQEKLPQKLNSDVLTLNGLGHRAILNTFGRVTLDDKKVLNIIKSKRGRNRYGKYNTLSKETLEREYILAKAVAVAKCIDISNSISQDVYDNMLSTYDLEEYPGMYSQMLSTLEESDNNTKVIDFADQLRFPVIYNCAMPQYSVVLGDEVQDFNPVQAVMVQLLHADKYVFVGDSHQSIYGFRGAMNDSMKYLKDTFNCIELPLSITYRCAKNIVKEAAAIYSDIEPWDMSPDGIVRRSTSEAEQYCSEDIILCRLNRPLIELAYQLLSVGVPCHVRGRDIGQGLIRLVKRHIDSIDNVRDLMTVLWAERESELQRAMLKDDDALQQRIEDRYSSLLLFCSKRKLTDSLYDVIGDIDNLFSEGRGVCLTTVHKAKGLEAHRALLLQTELFTACAARAKHAWQVEQEHNVFYVAVTRAKGELVYM